MFEYSEFISPVALSILGFDIRWYSLSYIFGFLYFFWFSRRNLKVFNLDKKLFEDLFFFNFLGIILGGRLGYVFFYDFDFYITNPLSIIKIWEGGMSFHGALIGIIFGTNLFAFNRKISSFFLLDAISCVAPIGIFFGRLANFINAELVGKVTEVSWAVIFPTIDLLPRHPSQLYEAFLEGLILFLILNIYILKRNYKTGACSCLFLINYGIFRIISEFYREPDSQVGYLFDQFSMGAILSFLMIVAGAILIVFIKKNEK